MQKYSVSNAYSGFCTKVLKTRVADCKIGTLIVNSCKNSAKCRFGNRWFLLYICIKIRRAPLPSFFCYLSPENFLWRRIFFLWSRKFFLWRKTFFFWRRKNLRCFLKKYVKLFKNFLTEVKVLNFFTFWARVNRC